LKRTKWRKDAYVDSDAPQVGSARSVSTRVVKRTVAKRDPTVFVYSLVCIWDTSSCSGCIREEVDCILRESDKPVEFC